MVDQVLIFKSQVEARVHQQEQKVAKIMDGLTALNNRVTQFALGGVGTGSGMPGSGTPSPDLEQRLQEYERKVNRLLSTGGEEHEGQFKKLKEQVRKQKEKTNSDSNLLKEIEMKFNSLQRSMPNFEASVLKIEALEGQVEKFLKVQDEMLYNGSL